MSTTQCPNSSFVAHEDIPKKGYTKFGGIGATLVSQDSLAFQGCASRSHGPLQPRKYQEIQLDPMQALVESTTDMLEIDPLRLAGVGDGRQRLLFASNLHTHYLPPFSSHRLGTFWPGNQCLNTKDAGKQALTADWFKTHHPTGLLM